MPTASEITHVHLDTITEYAEHQQMPAKADPYMPVDHFMGGFYGLVGDSGDA